MGYVMTCHLESLITPIPELFASLATFKWPTALFSQNGDCREKGFFLLSNLLLQLFLAHLPARLKAWIVHELPALPVG